MGVTVLLWTNRYKLFRHNVAVNSELYPIKGIDVSVHNGRINFEQLKADSISFVIIKASEGTTLRDKKYRHNHRMATKSGMKVGAYHYFRKGSDGEAQARNFLRAVKGTHVDMPLIIDVEDWGNDRNVADSTALDNLVMMVHYLNQKGAGTMIYTNGDGYKKYYLNALEHLPLWLCSFKEPETLVSTGHVIQQYSHWGSVDGIKGEVDLNVFMGSAEAWDEWISKNQYDL